MSYLARALRIAVLGFALAGIASNAIARADSLPAAPAPSASFDSGMLHVDRYGSGSQALVLIPGLGSGPWTWYGTIAHFSPSYSIYVVTLPGFDGRPATAERPLFAAFSRDFWAMLAQQHVVKPVLIGHSLGGTLSFMLAEQHPERLGGVVAVDGLPVFPAVATATPADRAAMAQKLAAQIDAETPAQFLAYEQGFMSGIGVRDAALAAQTAQLEAASDRSAVAAWLQEDVAGDLRPELSKISVPVLVVMPYDSAVAAKMGGFSQEQAVAFYRSLVAGTPNVTVQPIAPARHFAMLDQPDAFYAAVAAFLKTLNG